MAEQLIINSKDKKGIYGEIIPQIEAILGGESDVIANMANLSSVLMEAFHHLWVGFYLVKPVIAEGSHAVDHEELVLGPFQGPLACTRIKRGRGVCGTAWEKAETLVVPDVDAFPGHIACSSLSRSEIVVPVFGGDGKVAAVLDIDSKDLSAFDETDRVNLEKIVSYICMD